MPSVLAEHSAWVVRYALGSVQYRSMLEWSDQALVEAQAAYDRVSNFIERAGVALGGQPSREEVTAVSADDLPADFVAAMNDDVNVSGATAAIFTAIRSGNTLLSQLADRADSETAKAEVDKPFVRENELRIKTARLEELNALLNMDNKEQPEVEPEPPKKSREKEWER